MEALWEDFGRSGRHSKRGQNEDWSSHCFFTKIRLWIVLCYHLSHSSWVLSGTQSFSSHFSYTNHCAQMCIFVVVFTLLLLFSLKSIFLFLFLVSIKYQKWSHEIILLLFWLDSKLLHYKNWNEISCNTKMKSTCSCYCQKWLQFKEQLGVMIRNEWLWLQKAAEWVGFKGDKELGLKYLREVYSTSSARKDFAGVLLVTNNLAIDSYLDLQLQHKIVAVLFAFQFRVVSSNISCENSVFYLE